MTIEKSTDATRARPAAGEGQDPRLPYAVPRLRTYGPVHQVVRQFGPGPMSDAGNNRMAPFIPPPS
ncbi:MAG TPA: hypothetical protein VKU40_00655 [Thermoanaerobaculia bacterium]|nr:hypothetical protein [Thermoanaerobaculia bacterium]